MNQRREAQQSHAVWLPTDFADPDEWTIDLTDEERDEIVVAAERAVDAGTTIEDVVIADFPLPTLGARALEWSELLSGRGFVLLRGFPTDRLDRAAVEIAYLRARAPSRQTRWPGRTRNAARSRARRRRDPH